jgi:hypothetical protein
MKNIIIIILTSISFGEIINCAGQCKFNPNIGMGKCTSIYSMGSYNCEPSVGYGICPKGCIIKTVNTCMDDYPIPKTVALCPKYCYDNKNDVMCGGFTQNNLVNCNPSGSGTYCVNGCSYDDQNEKCIATVNGSICDPKMGLKCPNGCKYEKMHNKCIPMNPMIICELIPKTLQCPTNCIYNPYEKKCMSSNMNVVCGLEEVLLCPNSCMNNVYGDKCLPANSWDTTICNTQSEKQCPSNCYYNQIKNICGPKTINDICEPVTRLECPDLFIPNINVPNCTVSNMDEICSNKEGTVQFPTRLESKYSNIKCKYIVEMNCKYRSGIIRSCITALPNVDPIKNNCYQSKNIITGSYGMQCPMNSIANSIDGCYVTETLVCQEGYTLVNISTESNYVSRCVLTWYYGY